jgi:hypothetical protein
LVDRRDVSFFGFGYGTGETGVYPVRPLIKDVLNGESLSRFKTYGLLLNTSLSRRMIDVTWNRIRTSAFCAASKLLPMTFADYRTSVESFCRDY